MTYFAVNFTKSDTPRTLRSPTTTIRACLSLLGREYVGEARYIQDHFSLPHPPACPPKSPSRPVAPAQTPAELQAPLGSAGRDEEWEAEGDVHKREVQLQTRMHTQNIVIKLKDM